MVLIWFCILGAGIAKSDGVRQDESYSLPDSFVAVGEADTSNYCLPS